MQERETVQAPGPRLPRWSTPTLGIVGSTFFVSGLFVLAAAGHAYPWAIYLVILAVAAALAVPLFGITLVVAGTEALLGRAWANGLRRLEPVERGLAATSNRALRYASILWLANGAAMWFATLLAQF